MDLTIRPITEPEIDAFRRRMVRGFGQDLHEKEDGSRFRRTVDIARTVAGFDGDDIVGTCAALNFEVTVPGGALPMGGTTMITVQPTHRRRGVLRRMMDAHLAEMRGRGEPLAGLWASEASIYGRFGYGLAAECHQVKIDAHHIRFVGEPPPGDVRLVEADAARALLPPVYEQVRPTRPGMLTRTDAWWECRLFYDPDHFREGRTAQRYALYERDGAIEGYAVYRQKGKWDDLPEGEVFIVEMIAATPAAHAALWRYLTSIDLFPRVRHWNLPVDDGLPWLVAEPRRVQRDLTDTLWLRLLDVPVALAGRRYAAEGRVVIGITDPTLPDIDGAYELETGPDGAQCRRTSTTPDLEMGIDTLGARYLGAHRFATFARAGLVRGDDAALAMADRMFEGTVLPWCPEDF